MKGGVALSEGNESLLRFSLEESVWFQKGQEVAELLSVSLDPNITIHENDQYVTIEGALHLTGEYKRHGDEGSEEEEFPLSPKFVQEVTDRGEGITGFSHRFPVDITIPHNRIVSIYDIDVEIESFDYAFPERSCMKLTADLSITGLKGEETQQKATEQVEEEVELVSRVPEAEEPAKPAIQPVKLEETPPAAANDLFAPFVAEARKTEEENEEVQVELEDVPTLQVAEPNLPDISFAAQRNEGYQTGSNQHGNSQYEVDYESPSFTEDESSSSSSSEEIVKKKKKKITKKQGISITEFLARKEEADDVAKLKVCIVQAGDTLESVAERYDVNTQALLRVNHLEVNQDISEGQVLYIPLTPVFKS